MSEHSEQAKAAWKEYVAYHGRPNSDEIFHYFAHKFMSGFDLGHKAALAERRITDRETLWRTIAEHHQIGAKCRCGFDPRLDYNRMSQHIADAILALPSTPITSNRAVTAQQLGLALYGSSYDEAHADPEMWDWLVREQDGKVAKVIDALLASGLVKDNGDAQPSRDNIAMELFAADNWGNFITEHDSKRQPDEEYKRRARLAWCYGKAGHSNMQKYRMLADAVSAPVDRLAVIREVIDWFERDSDLPISSTTAKFAYEHFGVAPVEEEA